MHKLITCLVIDDNLKDQETFFEALKQAFPGASCWFAENCTQAIEKMKKKYASIPDYIFLDWKLPDTEGEDRIQQIRDSGLCNTCIFVLSGTIPPLNEGKLKALGIRKAITKKSEVDALSQELYDVIKA